MSKLIFKKGEWFKGHIKKKKDKEGLEKLTKREFSTLLDFAKEIRNLRAIYVLI